MLKKALVLIGIVAIVASGIWFFGSAGDGPSPESNSAVPDQPGADTAVTNDEPFSRSGAGQSSEANSASVSPNTDTQRILEITQAASTEKLPDEPSQNGEEDSSDKYIEGTSYLTKEELNRYLKLDDASLLSLAESGDVGAQTRLGTRLIRRHFNVVDGMDWLIEAASYGSFEALRELRWLYQYGAGPIQEDDFAFLAWAKVAYMVGDWQALWFQNASSNLSARELMVVDVLAASYFDEINNRHVSRTGRNLEITIRPGYREALQQFLGEGNGSPD